MSTTLSGPKPLLPASASAFYPGFARRARPATFPLTYARRHPPARLVLGLHPRPAAGTSRLPACLPQFSPWASRPSRRWQRTGGLCRTAPRGRGAQNPASGRGDCHRHCRCSGDTSRPPSRVGSREPVGCGRCRRGRAPRPPIAPRGPADSQGLQVLELLQLLRVMPPPFLLPPPLQLLLSGLPRPPRTGSGRHRDPRRAWEETLGRFRRPAGNSRQRPTGPRRRASAPAGNPQSGPGGSRGLRELKRGGAGAGPEGFRER